ncbi:MAG: hypothetical protein JW885_06875 [Deltaproteobacteria bacterium]|nr:hypothetical protein [Candidatus Zymogenaceae bacterium]
MTIRLLLAPIFSPKGLANMFVRPYPTKKMLISRPPYSPIWASVQPNSSAIFGSASERFRRSR